MYGELLIRVKWLHLERKKKAVATPRNPKELMTRISMKITICRTLISLHTDDLRSDCR